MNVTGACILSTKISWNSATIVVKSASIIQVLCLRSLMDMTLLKVTKFILCH